jgi:hypothetical protein
VLNCGPEQSKHRMRALLAMRTSGPFRLVVVGRGIRGPLERVSGLLKQGAEGVMGRTRVRGIAPTASAETPAVPVGRIHRRGGIPPVDVTSTTSSTVGLPSSSSSSSSASSSEPPSLSARPSRAPKSRSSCVSLACFASCPTPEAAAPRAGPGACGRVPLSPQFELWHGRAFCPLPLAHGRYGQAAPPEREAKSEAIASVPKSETEGGEIVALAKSETSATNQ